MTTNGLKCRTTHGAHKCNNRISFLLLCEDALSPILVTLCTYPMRWFGLAHGFFKRIYDRTPPRGYKLIALLLTFPCFYASDFFFKCAYFLNHRRLNRIGRKCATLGGQNSVLKLNNLPLDSRHRVQLYQALRNFTSELEASNRTLYKRYVHDLSFMVDEYKEV
jgi:hypothetical protein